MPAIKIAFLGLGGVGGYFGAKLARTYSQSDAVEVVFLARDKTSEIISKNGIRLITPQEEFITHPRKISSDPSAIGVVDFLIVSVKSYDLEESLAQFSACIGPHTIILPLLNGIDAGGRIAKLFPSNEIWDGCVYIVARQLSPGVIKETGNIHQLHFGGSSNEKTLALLNILKLSHDDVFLHANIRDVVWEKFVFISTVASATTYFDKSVGEILTDTEIRKSLLSAIEEIVAIARKLEIHLSEDIIARTIAKMEKLPYETTSSMHSDFKNGSRTEYLSLTKHVVNLAHHCALETPTFKMMLSKFEK